MNTNESSASFEAVLFYEVQSFRKSKLGAFLAVLMLLTLVFEIFMLMTTLYSQNADGARITEQKIGIGASTFALCISCGILALLWLSRLIVRVEGSGLFVRFVPFHLREHRIDLSGLVSVKARTYRPIREYGGWGIRFGSRGKAYNVRGDRGVQLEFSNGEPLLIGSQRAEELETAIRQLAPSPLKVILDSR